MAYLSPESGGASAVRPTASPHGQGAGREMEVIEMRFAFYTFSNGKDSNSAESVAVCSGIRHKLKVKPRGMQGNCMIGLLVPNADRKKFLKELKKRSIRPAYYTQIDLEIEPEWVIYE